MSEGNVRLKPVRCPFCKAQPNLFDDGYYEVFHEDKCYLEQFRWLRRDHVERWNTRAADQERVKDLANLTAELAAIAGYAATVRIDRKQKDRFGDEYCLQTEDWCKGLVEYAERAETALKQTLAKIEKEEK